MPEAESTQATEGYRCRVCSATVTGPADRAHDGAAHDARTANMPAPMTPQRPAAPETETDANGIVALLATHRYMPCSQHTPTVNAWWAQCEGCDWRGPRRSQRHSDEGDHRLHLAGIIADAARERVRVVEVERDAALAGQRGWRATAFDLEDRAESAEDDLVSAEGEREHWKRVAGSVREQAEGQQARAESAEAAHEAEKAAHERLRAGIWALGESIHGDEGVEHVEGCEGEPTCFACILAELRALLAQH